jgi:hypothetical protein
MATGIKGLDLTKVKEEISKQKKEKTNSDPNKVPHDKFLHRLVTSLKTGQINEATKTIASIDNKADLKRSSSQGKTPSLKLDENILKHVEQPQARNIKQEQNIDYFEKNDKEREKIFEEEIEKRNREYLNRTNNVNDSLSTALMKETTTQQKHSINEYPNTINENLLNEMVEKRFNNFINENFANVVEEAMKNTIIEIYSMERVKKAIRENENIIEKMVIDTIKKLQDRQKQKKSQSNNQ